MWELTYTDEFQAWWDTLDDATRASILAGIQQLPTFGPALGRPLVDTIRGSRYSNMKELRTQHRGRPYRTFFAFDPRRMAVLLIGGDKSDDPDFYDRMIPIADAAYTAYLELLGDEKAER